MSLQVYRLPSCDDCLMLRKYYLKILYSRFSILSTFAVRFFRETLVNLTQTCKNNIHLNFVLDWHVANIRRKQMYSYLYHRLTATSRLKIGSFTISNIKKSRASTASVVSLFYGLDLIASQVLKLEFSFSLTGSIPTTVVRNGIRAIHTLLKGTCEIECNCLAWNLNTDR